MRESVVALCVGVRDDVTATSSRRPWWVGVLVGVSVALGDLVNVMGGERERVGVGCFERDAVGLRVDAPDFVGLAVACGDLVGLTGMQAPHAEEV